MTVPSEAAGYSSFAWTGAETSFSPGFRALADSHVLMISRVGAVDTALTLGVHYGVTRAADGTVTVTPIALPTAPTTLLIYRITPAIQTVDFVNLGQFTPATHTALHDAAAMRDAELRRDIAALTPAGSGFLGFPAPSADKLIGWNSAGNALVNISTAALLLAAVSSAIASQAQAVAGVSNTTFMTPLRTQQHYDSQLAVAHAWTASQLFSPPAGTTNVAIAIEQSSPASGSVATPLTFNTFNITNRIGSTAGGQTDGTNNNNVVGLKVNYITGGANLGSSQQAAIFGHLRQTIAAATGGDKGGVAGLGYSNVVDSGGGFLYGGTFGATLDNGGSHTAVEGGECDVGILTGGSALYRFGVGIWNTGQVAGSTLDAALYVTSASAGGEFRNLLVLTNFAGQKPLATDADLFDADTAYTIANVFNLPTMTVTGSILNFPNVNIFGSGLGAFYRDSLQVTSTDGLVLRNRTPAAAGAGLQQFSPRLRLSGEGWKSNATAASQTVDWIVQNQPGEGTANPSTALLVAYQINGAGYVPHTSFNSDGVLAVATRVQAPTLAGGAGAASTLTLESTSIAGTTDRIIFKTGSQVHRGAISSAGLWSMGSDTTPNPGVVLTVNANTAPPAVANDPRVFLGSPTPLADTIVSLVGLDGGTARLLLDAYGNSGQMFFRRANTSQTAPSNLVAGNIIGGIFGQGYGSSGYNANGATGAIALVAGETWSNTTALTYIDFYTTPTGAITPAQVMRLWGSGGLALGTTADPGAGALLASAAIKSQHATAGIGYATGAGGSVTQSTNKSTGVTLNKICGEIVMNGAALAAAVAVGFTLTNSAIAATDVIKVNIKSAATANSYTVCVTAVASGSCRIELYNTNGGGAGSLSEAVVLTFAVIKAVVS